MKKKTNIQTYLKKFSLSGKKKTYIQYFSFNNLRIPIFINEFWTSKQRQAHSLHEIAYRACFKPQLPKFFIELFTKKNDVVYDPFSGRGTTIIESALLQRNIISNDINPLNKILCSSRLHIPTISEIEQRLSEIPNSKKKFDINLTMFYHPKTLEEILSLKNYLYKKNNNGTEDYIDSWIRMVATNRLTGHSKGFFSVYTLPPNQAISPERQKKINTQRKQKPEYRNTKELILKKTKSLLRNITQEQIHSLQKMSSQAKFLQNDARSIPEIKNNSVQLTITSPPFLDVVQYADDNWLRCWFNSFDAKTIEKKITMSKTIDDWCNVMGDVFKELYRITKRNGWVAFEVGEIKHGKIHLEEHVVALGINAGFFCECIMINQQTFTKTANIWGVKNNTKGTNSNRIVLFYKR